MKEHLAIKNKSAINANLAVKKFSRNQLGVTLLRETVHVRGNLTNSARCAG